MFIQFILGFSSTINFPSDPNNISGQLYIDDIYETTVNLHPGSSAKGCR